MTDRGQGARGHRWLPTPPGLGELYLGLSPVFVLLGEVAITAAVAGAAVLSLRHWREA